MKLDILGCSYNTYYRIYRNRYVISPTYTNIGYTLNNKMKKNVFRKKLKKIYSTSF